MVTVSTADPTSPIDLPSPTSPIVTAPTANPNAPVDATPLDASAELLAQRMVNLVLTEHDDNQMATFAETPFDPETEIPIHRGLLALKLWAAEDATKVTFPIATVLNQDLQVLAARYLSMLTDGAKAYLRAGCVDEAVHLDEMEPTHTNPGVYIFTIDNLGDKYRYTGSGTSSKGGLYGRARDHLRAKYQQLPGQTAYRRYQIINDTSIVAVCHVRMPGASLGKFLSQGNAEGMQEPPGVGLLDDHGLSRIELFGTSEQLAEWGRRGIESQKLQYGGKSGLTKRKEDRNNETAQIESIVTGRKGSARQIHAERRTKLNRFHTTSKKGNTYITQSFNVLGREGVNIDRVGLSATQNAPNIDIKKVKLTVEIADENTHHRQSYLPHPLDKDRRTDITRVALKLQDADTAEAWTFYNRFSKGTGGQKKRDICLNILRAFNDEMSWNRHGIWDGAEGAAGPSGH
ncbi:hypothetical protein DFS34DRAFT_596403 [Phlyctochytrium arcticum]|nr:hypothetical protein DFS34DRAFT_596403 [Phlyctochytrium arcticum]